MVNANDQTGRASPINFAWIELLPMMIVLLAVVFFVGFYPTFDWNPHIVANPEIDNVLNNFTLGVP